VKEVNVPVEPTRNVDIESTTWGFGLWETETGISTFSPEKALEEEIEVSLPITIRYSETFSTEGMIYMYGVRGELESFYSTLEDVCQKAKGDESRDIKFTKEFHFSYPVEYRGGDICMLDSCKQFSCPYDLEFENIQGDGDYLLAFSYDSGSGIISVEK
jgi:hypothetical protein